MRASARPKISISSGVPTVTRIAPGAPKPRSGRTITPSRRQRLEQRLRVLAHLDVEEVRNRGTGSNPCARELALQRGEALRVECAAARQLLLELRRAEARDGGLLGGRGDVESPARLAQGANDLLVRDDVADPQPGEPEDLRERPQHDRAAPLQHVLVDRVVVVRMGDVLEVGLVDDCRDVIRDALEPVLDLGAGVHRAGGVVRQADVRELRARRDRRQHRVEVVAMVVERHRCTTAPIFVA